MKIEFRCIEEQRTIGHIEVLNERATRLDARTVWNGFVPADADYQLGSRPAKDGQYFMCPRCGGHVEVVNARTEVKERAPTGGPRPAAMSRDEARRHIMDKVHAHEYVDSAGRSGPGGRPMVLGATTVKAKQ